MTRSPRMQMRSGRAAFVRSTVEWSLAIPLKGEPTCRSVSTATRKDRSPGQPTLNSCSATVRLAGSNQNAQRPSVTRTHPTTAAVDAHIRRLNHDLDGVCLTTSLQPRRLVIAPAGVGDKPSQPAREEGELIGSTNVRSRSSL